MKRALLSLSLISSLFMGCTPEGFIAFNQSILDAAEKNGIDLTIESEATFSESTKTTIFGETTEDEKVDKVVFKGSVKKEQVKEVQEEIVEETKEVEVAETTEDVEEEIKEDIVDSKEVNTIVLKK